MATIKDIEREHKCIVLSRAEAIRVVEGLTRMLADFGGGGLPVVAVTNGGYRLAFAVDSKE